MQTDKDKDLDAFTIMILMEYKLILIMILITDACVYIQYCKQMEIDSHAHPVQYMFRMMNEMSNLVCPPPPPSVHSAIS